jgi:hypothetical protein
MNRIFKTAALAGIAVIGIIGTATAASASVAVTDGVGFVGKGDVQTALGYANDAAIQQAVKDGKITFSGGTATAEKIWATYDIDCWGSNLVAHQIFYIPGTATTSVTAAARTNGKDKSTNGWDLKGQTVGEFSPDAPFNSSNIPMRWEIPEGCSPGAGLAGSAWYPDFNGPVHVTGSTSGLFVSNGVKTVALPNTPVPTV